MNPLRISGDFCERVDRVLRDFVSSFWKELPSDRRYPLVRRLDFVVVVVVVVGFFAFAFCRDGADDVRDEHRDPSSYRHRLKVGEIVAKSSSSKSSSSLSPGRNSRRDEMDKKMTFWNIFSSSFPKAPFTNAASTAPRRCKYSCPSPPPPPPSRPPLPLQNGARRASSSSPRKEEGVVHKGKREDKIATTEGGIE
mgnify:CR=1 FL=1